MGIFFVYSIKVALCLIAFYLVYKLLLSRETFHLFNRLVLLGVVVLSLIIPFIHLKLQQSSSAGDAVLSIEQWIMQAEVASDDQLMPLTLMQVLFIIYIIGVITLLLKDIISTLRLRRLLRRGQHIAYDDGMTIVVMNEDIAPFSWFNYVVISRSDYDQNARDIITHEEAHIRRHHSFDILMCNLLIDFQWYNPAAWLIKQEMQDVHEYEADDAVLSEGIDAKHYQLLLIRKAVGERLFSMANNMNHNSLKKRITMMKKDRSNPQRRMNALAILPVAAIAIVAFANQRVETMAQTIAQESNAVVSKISATAPDALTAATEQLVRKSKKKATSTEQTTTDGDDTSSEKAYDAVEEMPEFVGGAAALMQYLTNNIKYPANAAKNNVEGRVIVSFIVDKDGSVVEPEVTHGVDAELDAEALRVVSAMPKWKPGKMNGEAVRVKYNVPIMFRNPKQESSASQTMPTSIPSDDATTSSPTAKAKKTTVFVDGKKMTQSQLNAIDPSTIESITVVKEASAVAKYGKDAGDAVIDVKLKK